MIAPLVFAEGSAATQCARLLVEPFGRFTVAELADHKCGQKRRAGFGVLDHGRLKRLRYLANGPWHIEAQCPGKLAVGHRHICRRQARKMHPDAIAQRVACGRGLYRGAWRRNFVGGSIGSDFSRPDPLAGAQDQPRLSCVRAGAGFGLADNLARLHRPATFRHPSRGAVQGSLARSETGHPRA